MDPVLASLLLARERLAAAIAAAMENPMPDYDLDEQEFKWGMYRATLLKELELLDKAIQRRKGVRVQWLGKENTEVVP